LSLLEIAQMVFYHRLKENTSIFRKKIGTRKRKMSEEFRFVWSVERGERREELGVRSEE
jgi:hypothetical protein